MKKIVTFCKAFLLAFALTAEFHLPLVAAHYEEKIDYITASFFELLGNYDFKFLLILAAAYFFFDATEKKVFEKKYAYMGLSALFAGFVLIGNSYYEAGNWSYCFGSVVNLIKTVPVLFGYAFAFQRILCLFAGWIKTAEFVSEETHFFSKHAFWKAFCILSLVYGVFLILSYPGNLCWDVIGQIEQVTMDKGFSTHHPLAHTLLIGGIIECGRNLFGSAEIGLFLYMWVQMFLFAAALSGTIKVLAERKLKKQVLGALLLLYIITPIYTNLVSTAIKDIPFMAFVIGYFVCYALLLENPKRCENIKFVITFVLLQVGVILFRNNGLPMVLISGVVAWFFVKKKLTVKESLKSLVTLCVAGVAVGLLLSNLLAGICNATSGSKGEILSIPFQQTARYLQFYQYELEEEERIGIETVLGDVSEVAVVYDPDISDPVKKLFRADATGEELLGYFKAWFRGLCKHPDVYVEAFLAHVHGWFSPAISNSIRYETDYTDISQHGIFPDANKVLVFFYRFANRITVLGVLENVGMAVWALFFLTLFARKEKRRIVSIITVPLWVSLLICMASPCFYGHPRYALPIMMTLPFLYGFMIQGKSEEREHAE